MSPDNSCCVSVRARVRKSRRAIDPEFDACQETLVSFVDNNHNHHHNKGNSKQTKDAAGPSLLLTPVPTVIPNNRARSLSRGNTAPVKRRNRSYSNFPGDVSHHGRKQSTASLSSTLCSSDQFSREYQRGFSTGGLSDGEGGGMVDVSLDDDTENKEVVIEGALGESAAKLGGSATTTNSSSTTNGTCPLNVSQHSHPLLNTKPGLPPQPMIPSHHNHQQRYSSPLPVHRTSSGASNGAGSVISHASRSSARSRSRSRSRRMGGHLRMRSLGAASAFAAASGNSPMNGEEEGMDGSLHGTQAKSVEPVEIPLKDILSVDEELPSKSGGERGSNAGGGGSDFYSSAASDVGAAKEAKKENATTAAPPQLRSPSPPPSSNSGKVPYRIFLHTLSHGYVEFSLENVNSHDVFMAYLKAHLESDRIPNRDDPKGGSKRESALLRTMVLTPTKEVPSNLSSSSRTHEDTSKGANSDPADSTNHTAVNSTSIHSQHSQSQPPPPPPPSRTRTTSLPRPNLVSRSNSTISCNIDKLHSKVINQRLASESTPLQRMKESIAGWMSTVMDCACCQDTTVAPLDVSAASIQGTPDKVGKLPKMPASPNTQRLRGKGITGLSFEEISNCGGGTPKLSFEQTPISSERKRRS